MYVPFVIKDKYSHNKIIILNKKPFGTCHVQNMVEDLPYTE